MICIVLFTLCVSSVLLCCVDGFLVFSDFDFVWISALLSVLVGCRFDLMVVIGY